MRIDWVVAIGVFLVFIGTAFQYYSNLFQSRAQPMGVVVGDISDRVTDFLLTDVYEVSVKVSSPEAKSDVLYFDYTWPSEGAKNSTRILQDSTSKDCIISGSTLYFQTDLSVGENFFTMKFSNKNVSMNCSGTFGTGNSNQTIPWAGVKKKMISQSKIDEMNATSYTTFKDDLGINRDFRVGMNVNGTITSYGLNPPNATNVYVKETRWALEETDEEVIIRVLAW